MDRRRAIFITVFIILAGISTLVAMASIKAALALILGLSVAVLVFFKPFYGLIMYIILIYVMPQVFYPPLRKLRIMLVLATLILLVFLIHKVFRRENIAVVSTRQHLLMLILLIIVPISNIVNFRLGASWKGFNEFLTVFLLFFIIVSLADDFGKFRKVCWTLVVCTTMLAINGLIQHFRGYDLVGNAPVDGRIHWMSHFGDPNDFALAINSFLPFILVNLFEKDTGKFKKTILLVMAGIFLIAIYYTNSRGGYVALLVILALFAYKRWGLLRGILVGAVFVVLAVVLAPSRMEDVSPYEASASGRVNAWIAGLVMLKSHPVLGIGYGNFQIYHNRAAHSAFIQCMSELGMAGYFTWLALIYSSYSGFRKVEKSAHAAHAKYAKIIQLSLVGFLASAVFLSQAFSPILYIILALSALAPQFTEPPLTLSRNLLRRDYLLIAAIAGGSIIAYKLLAVIYV